MKLIVFIAIFFVAPIEGFGESLVAARNIRSHTILSSTDVTTVQEDVAGSYRYFREVEGMETRTTLYAGRPIRPGDVGPAAIIERNQIVPLVYFAGGLIITAEGRSLGRAGPGDRVRVMNISSRTTVSGTAMADGSVSVGN